MKRLNLIAFLLLIVTVIGCGGEGGGSTSTSSIDPTGTWKVMSVNGQDISSYNATLVVGASAYSYVQPDMDSSYACDEFGAWSVNGSTLSFTPISGSTCGDTATYSYNVSTNGNTMALTRSGNTYTVQKQSVSSVGDVTGTWRLMGSVQNGSTAALSSYNAKVVLNAATYSYSQPYIDSTRPACSEAGTWSLSGDSMNVTPSSGGTCGHSSLYSFTISVNGTIMTTSTSSGAEADIYEKLAGASNTAPAVPSASSGSGQITINWLAVTGASSYNVYRGTASGSISTKTMIATVSSSTYTDITASPGTTYYYQITAVDDNGESAASTEVNASAAASSQSQIPSPVTGISPTAGNGQVSLTWNAVSGATSYNVYYSYTPSGYIVPIPFWYVGSTSSGQPSHYSTFSNKISGITSTQYIHTGLTNGATYQYMVTAVNSNGEGYATSYVEAVPAATAVSGVTWTPRTSGTTNPLYGVAYSGSKFVAVGGVSGTSDVIVSTDGINWPVKLNGSAMLTRVIWCSSLSEFVAVGQYGAIFTSSDGLTWYSQTSGTSQTLWGITYSSALSMFVAVGNAGTILTSSDGISWTTQTSGTSNNLRRVIRWGNQFVAVGWSGTILTSPDGIAWTSRSSGTSLSLNGIAGSGSTYVATGSNGTILTSPDGITWTSRNSGTTNGLRGVIWTGTQFMAGGDLGTILTSPDGVNWSSQYSGTTDSIGGISWNGSIYVAVGDAGTILTSQQ